MGTLTSKATEGFRKGHRRATLPPWYAFAPIAGIVLLVVGGLAAVLLPSPTPPTSSTQGQGLATSAPTRPAPSQGTGADPTPTPSATTPPDVPQADVEVPSLTDANNTTAVPADALGVAQSYAAATFTGSFEEIEFAEGTEPPQPPVLAATADPVVDQPRLAAADSGRLTFLFKVDPDGPGPEQPRDVYADVILVQGRWKAVGT